ncbi:unnamed protein product, partial [marine sediment metagenome]
SQVSLEELREELQRRLDEPDDEELKEESVEKFEFRDQTERQYAFHRLTSRYPYGVIMLICKGEVEAPLWLQQEILKVREGGDDIETGVNYEIVNVESVVTDVAAYKGV